MMLPTRVRSERSDPVMTPMIDVVFLLLIFFLWTASFQIVEELLPASFAKKRPPAAAGSQASASIPAESEIVVLKLRRSSAGSVVAIINDREVSSWNEIRDTIRQVAEIDASTPVVIDPETVIPYGEAIRALDIARGVGMQKVHFAAPELPR